MRHRAIGPPDAADDLANIASSSGWVGASMASASVPAARWVARRGSGSGVVVQPVVLVDAVAVGEGHGVGQLRRDGGPAGAVDADPSWRRWPSARLPAAGLRHKCRRRQRRRWPPRSRCAGVVVASSSGSRRTSRDRAGRGGAVPLPGRSGNASASWARACKRIGCRAGQGARASGVAAARPARSRTAPAHCGRSSRISGRPSRSRWLGRRSRCTGSWSCRWRH